MRITAEHIKEAWRKASHYKLCAQSFGIETDDIQTVGYDYLCALAMLETGNGYERINKAKDKIKNSPYHAGFQKGWDDITLSFIGPVPENESEGFADGRAAAATFKWNAGWTREGIAAR